MPSAFHVATAVAPDPQIRGRFTAHLPATWSAPNVPWGGLSLATAARAMQAALPEPMPVRSLSCVFAAPVEAGAVEIDVTVVRAGRSVAQVLAHMRTPGRAAGLTAIAVFGSSRPGFEFTDLAPPDFPAVESLPSFRDPLPDGIVFDRDPFPLWVHHVEGKPVSGHAPWEEYIPSTSERASYQRFDEPPLVADGSVDPFALVALCDTMPGAVAERLGWPIEHDWYGPSADLTVHVVGTARSEWLLARSRARRAADGYASVEMEIWDPATGLVAYATQTMIFTFFGAIPEGEARLPLDMRS
ncbi:MAG: acyl-CoA thioesterase [Acidimicrobiia bacterium]